MSFAVYTGGRDKVGRKAFMRAKGYVSAAFDANLASAKASGWHTHEFDCSHDVMVIQPQELADALLQAA